MSDPAFPVAQVVTMQEPWHQRVSRMWILTFACVALAVGLTWYSLDSPGTLITIRFPDGHGLRTGDLLRHRGIDIGQVNKIELSESLDEITVHAALDATAAAIASEGSRFWIVRPRLDLTGVSGLETAVGAKYIAVAPGGSKLKKFKFEGLGNRPPGGGKQQGIEIILRGDHRYGVNPGSPLTWRGVEVGTVLDSKISPDASNVDTRVQVDQRYRRLVSRDSKFWVTSGIHIGFDIGGFELSAESLATIVRGGISFITPDGAAPTVDVQPGDVFTLHEQRDDSWITSPSSVNLLRLAPPPVGQVEASWKRRSFGFTRNGHARASAIMIGTGDTTAVLLPSDLAAIPEGAIEGTFQLSYNFGADQEALEPITQEQVVVGVSRIPVKADRVPESGRLLSERVRVPVSPEDCFVVRHSWHSDDDSAVVIEMIGKEELRATETAWVAADAGLSRAIWHGALVIASQDEKAIGMLLIVDDLATVVPFSPLHVNE